MDAGPRTIFPVLLAGGSRWRVSLLREHRPEQSFPLTGRKTLFQQTALCAADKALFEPLTAIGSLHHRSLIAEQLREIGARAPTIVLEPCPRGTAAVAAVAALLVSRSRPDAVMLLMPADHRLDNLSAFLAAIEAGHPTAKDGAIVLFGIHPGAPASGHGYIRMGERLAGKARVHKVGAFVEKPDRGTAERYLENGGYLWDSGIVLLQAQALLSELARNEPDVLRYAQEALDGAVHDGDFLRLDAQAFASCPSTSIDYAVMKRTERAAVVSADFGWTDVGLRSARPEIAERDEPSNIGDVFAKLAIKHTVEGLRAGNPAAPDVRRHVLTVDGFTPTPRDPVRVPAPQHGLSPPTPRVSGRVDRRKIVVVSYGVFDCNSAGHIAGFSNALVRLGHRVAVCGAGKISSVYAFGTALFEFFGIEDFAADPEGAVGFDGKFEPNRTILLCWTPREIVRRAVAPVVSRHGIPYVVHLEDNEEHLSEVHLGRSDPAEPRTRPFPESLTDPLQLPSFLSGAAGVTVIEPRLHETLPPSLPSLVLEPGVDLELFGAEIDPIRRATIRRSIGVPPSAALIVYPGNVHRANVHEMRPLYETVGLLRGRSRNVVLVRTGTDYANGADFLEKAGPETGVIKLGHVDRPFLIDLLKSADLFVQPGRPGPFNDFRLPSKLPEFMAVGRPIVLPATNVGARMRDGVDALLLREGSAEETAARVEAILDDPALASRLSENARAFARQHFRWERQAAKLAGFLERVCRP